MPPPPRPNPRRRHPAGCRTGRAPRGNHCGELSWVAATPFRAGLKDYASIVSTLLGMLQPVACIRMASHMNAVNYRAMRELEGG
jgi:hypothetical protein